ncbi:MAG: glycosyl transferase family 36 [Casimicrobiaceae bacterium]
MPATTPQKFSRRQHCLLSNGAYSVMLSDSGSGFSRWHDLAVTRWREDVAGDPWGSYLLLGDEDSGDVWSATRQPCGTKLPDDTVIFSAGRAAFSRRRDDLHSLLEVAVACDADIELRRLVLTNHGDRSRTLSITSYAEMVVGPVAADNAHPAYSKMFVQTERDAASGLLLATRRRRSNSESEIWAAHTMQVPGEPVDGILEYETDRARFLGRGRTLRHAQAMQPQSVLSNSSGCVLDPVFSLRRRVSLAPGATATLLLWTKLSDSRAGALALSGQLAKADAAEQLFCAAATHAEREHKQLDIDAQRAARIGHWLNAVLVSDPGQRPASDVLAQGRGGPPVLWGAGISGDRPILLQCIESQADLARTRDLFIAQNHWRSKRLAVDVVLLNMVAGDAGDILQTMLEPLATAQISRLKSDSTAIKSELFALRDRAISVDLRNGLLSAARVVLGFADREDDGVAPAALDARTTTAIPTAIKASEPAGLASSASAVEFANSTGGFSDGGRNYEIQLTDDRCTPAPWVNVMANPSFGCLVSAEGGGYTWSLNSQQNAITPWPNDPVSDSPHEVLYLRDEDSGQLWSATALPIRVVGATYGVTHGKGCSRFANDARGIDLELTVCVPPVDSIKLSRLRLCNRSGQTRRLSVTAYVEWALGANGTTSAPYVITACDGKTGALFASNPWRGDFADRVAFLDLSGRQHSMSGDRCAFLGPLGSVDQPAALQDGSPLPGRVGAGIDPCGALQTRIELPPHTQIDLVLLLGDAAGTTQAQALIEKYRSADIEQVLAQIGAQWREVLDTIQVVTPNRALDILLNDWLLYQALGCRVWARTAYYQASGAYGFRDQLQDIMALCVSRPDLAREHLLRAAGRQFAEGDVQHWWLPSTGAGIRTRISDDRGWLAYVAAHYVDVTGDTAVLDEALPFLVGHAIADGATDAFFVPTASAQNVSVYEHCALAIDASLTCGAHGLPLMWTGDWNDGMNAVGEHGRGESVWLGWFLLATIAAFTPHAERRGEGERASRWADYAAELRNALERAWDGQWYRRGYYDDGSPLGSHESTECQIDAIAQSWSVMAGASNREHAAQAMAAVDRMLVDHHNRIALLFTPPFDHGAANPGYIKGYPPGVRENGGQYTHGAIWSIFAWAKLGDGDRGGALFDSLNPILHSDSAESVERYKVEPYVSCADVYSVAPYVGRGGWTWYSGSGAWLYRAGLEALLGFQLHGDHLRIDPCIPKHWEGFQLTYMRRGRRGIKTEYRIAVKNPRLACRGVSSVELDGIALAAADSIVLVDDGNTHALRIVIG